VKGRDVRSASIEPGNEEWENIGRGDEVPDVSSLVSGSERKMNVITVPFLLWVLAAVIHSSSGLETPEFKARIGNWTQSLP
jgi:hypothetical protein